MKLYTYTAEHSLPRIAVYGLPGDPYGYGSFPFWPNMFEAAFHALENMDLDKDKMVVLEVDSDKTGNVYGVMGEEAWAIHSMIEEDEGTKRADEFIRALETVKKTEDWFKVIDVVNNMADIKAKHVKVLGPPPENTFDMEERDFIFPTKTIRDYWKPVTAWKRPMVTRLLRSIFLPQHKLYGKGGGARMGQVEAVEVGQVDVEEPQIIDGVELVWAAGKKFPRGLRGAFGREAGDAMIALIEEQIGERPGKLLGAGKRGAAYRLPSGRVLKVTMDAREMRASSRVLGVIHPNLARVWQTFVVRANGKGVGIIVRDAVDKTLDKADKEVHRELTQILNFEVDAVMAAMQQEDFAENEADLYAAAMEHATEELRVRGCELLEPQASTLLDIADAYRELEYLGVVGLDFGAENFGIVKKPKRRVVLFDYGMAFVSGKQDVPVLSLPEEPLEAVA